MKILVSIKAINENQGAIHLDETRMNLFDGFALEQALLFRDALKESIVDVICVGTDKASEILTRALGMGADQAIHINSEAPPLYDPFYTASLIAAHARGKAYDLILTGVMSEDLMQGQVGPMVAELLSIPCATSVISAHLSREGIDLERELEGGARESWEFPLPCVLTVQSGINTPRYPSLSGMLKAARNPATCFQAETLNPPAIRQIISRMSVPQKKRNAQVLDGTSEEKALKLAQILKEKGFLRA